VLSVSLPMEMGELNEKQMKRLEAKTKQLITRNGLSNIGSSQFVIYPEFNKLKEETVDLLKMVVKVEAEITFNIQQLDNGFIFHTKTIGVEGGGSSTEQAIYNAINEINPRSSGMQKFISTAKERLVNYYEQECSNLMNNATVLAEKKSYEKALSVLSSIPKEAKCIKEVNDLALNIFTYYQNQKCNDWLKQAKIFIAENQFRKALQTLSLIDPLMYCSEEAGFLISKIENQIDAKDREQWSRIQSRYHDKLQMESMRLEIIRDIMTAYYAKQTAIPKK
jgi:hypothetical protein